MGTNSAYQLTSGSQNIGIGTNAGQVLTTGSNNMYFGYDVKALTGSESNTIRFGNVTQTTGIIMPAPSSNISIGGTNSTITLPNATINQQFKMVESGTTYDVNPKIIDLYKTGFDAWTTTTTYYTISGTTFTLNDGFTGYVIGKKVTCASGQTATLSTGMNYIICNSSGVITAVASLTRTLLRNNIILFEIYYGNTADANTLFVANEAHPYTFDTSVSEYLHNTVGPVVGADDANISLYYNGTLATIPQAATTNNLITLSNTAGTLYDHGLDSTIVASNTQTFDLCYTNSSNITTRHQTSQTTFANCGVYINGIVVTTIPSNNYAFFVVYVMKNDPKVSTTNARFLIFMGNAVGTNATTLANTASSYVPAGAIMNCEIARLGYIILRCGSTTGRFSQINNLVIQKSSVGAQIIGGSGTTNHLALSNINGGTYSDGGHTNLTINVTTNASNPVNGTTTGYKTGTLWTNPTNSLFANIDETTASWRKIPLYNSDGTTLSLANETVTSTLNLSNLTPSNILYLDGSNNVTTTIIPTATTYSISGSNLTVTSTTAGSNITYTISNPQPLASTDSPTFNFPKLNGFISPSAGDTITIGRDMNENIDILGKARLLNLPGNYILALDANSAIVTTAQLTQQTYSVTSTNLTVTSTTVGTATTITINEPQSLSTVSSPTFVNTSLTGLTASQYVKTNPSKQLTSALNIPLTDIDTSSLTGSNFLYLNSSKAITTSVPPSALVTSITGTANQTIVTNAGTAYTVSLAQSIAINSTPTFRQVTSSIITPDSTNFNSNSIACRISAFPCPTFSNYNTWQSNLVDSGLRDSLPNDVIMFYYNTTTGKVEFVRKDSGGLITSALPMF
jgi:hypothetical protein